MRIQFGTNYLLIFLNNEIEIFTQVVFSRLKNFRLGIKNCGIAAIYGPFRNIYIFRDPSAVRCPGGP